jgi:hypothetical protein
MQQMLPMSSKSKASDLRRVCTLHYDSVVRDFTFEIAKAAALTFGELLQ